ncbi:MAG: DUF881 domain-containing protein [Bacillota bacterium]
MRNRPWQFYVALVCIFLGAMVTLQLRTQASQKISPVESKNASLIDTIDNLDHETAVLEDQIGQLRDQIDSYQEQLSSGKGPLNTLQDYYSRMKTEAGLVEVSGPGIVVTLDDNEAGALAAKNTNPDIYKAENFLIHDKDVLYMVNELKVAGAEAISVNSQRITSYSEIRCVGPVIMINTTRVAPPFEIKAIGDPAALEEAVLNGEQFPRLKSRDFPVKLTNQTEIVIPAFKGSYRTQYAQIVQEGKGD